LRPTGQHLPLDHLLHVCIPGRVLRRRRGRRKPSLRRPTRQIGGHDPDPPSRAQLLVQLPDPAVDLEECPVVAPRLVQRPRVSEKDRRVLWIAREVRVDVRLLVRPHLQDYRVKAGPPGQDLDGLGRPVLRRRRPVHIPEEQDPIGAARGLDQHQRVESPFLCVRHEPADVVPLPPLPQARRHPRHPEHRHQTHHPPRPDPEPSTAQPPTRPSPAPPDLLPHALLPLSLPRHRRILQPPGRVPPLRAIYYCFSLSQRRLTGTAAPPPPRAHRTSRTRRVRDHGPPRRAPHEARPRRKEPCAPPAGSFRLHYSRSPPAAPATLVPPSRRSASRPSRSFASAASTTRAPTSPGSTTSSSPRTAGSIRRMT